jgi:hypothetical protein
LAGVAAPHADVWRIFNTGEVDAFFASACFKTSLVQAPATSIPDIAPGRMRQPERRETMGRLHPCCVSIPAYHQVGGDLHIQLPRTASLSAPFGIPGATGGPEIPQNFDVFNSSRNFVVNINFKEFLMKFKTCRKNIYNNKNDKTPPNLTKIRQKMYCNFELYMETSRIFVNLCSNIFSHWMRI